MRWSEKLRPGDFGVDVMHLNLHKTFSTPHGGGGRVRDRWLQENSGAVSAYAGSWLKSPMAR